jgi:ubiquinone/menaquinone biosynthesis C-methylase UbiE
MNEAELFRTQQDKLRKRLLKYTRRAFRMLPKLDSPRILDVGCGSGIPTIELARLSRGTVLGIDIDQPALDQFTRRINEMGLTGSVQTMKCSMVDMDFPAESYDIIWAEGAIYAIGFEKGLKEWRRFLKPDGFLVVHDEQGNVSQKLEQIAGCGYQTIGYFLLSKEVWRSEYFAPLGKLVGEMQKIYPANPEIAEEIREAKVELDWFRNNPEHSSSVYFVMKKD